MITRLKPKPIAGSHRNGSPRTRPATPNATPRTNSESIHTRNAVVAVLRPAGYPMTVDAPSAASANRGSEMDSAPQIERFAFIEKGPRTDPLSAERRLAGAVPSPRVQVEG